MRERDKGLKMNLNNPKQYVRIPMELFAAQGVKASTIATYASLASYADKKGFCFPSVPTIAERAGLSEKVARRECKKLVELGYLERRTHFDEIYGQRSNRFTLTWQRDDTVEKTVAKRKNGDGSADNSVSNPGSENDRLTRSIINQRQQTKRLAADIVTDVWSSSGKTQRKEAVIEIVADALENEIEVENLRKALSKLNGINTYVSAYSLNTALYPKPVPTLNADKKVDWSSESEDF